MTVIDIGASVEPHTFTAMEVLALAGITYRQLDYWTRSGYLAGCATGSVATPGNGYPRAYTPDETVRVAQIACLVRAGFRPGVACELAAQS